MEFRREIHDRYAEVLKKDDLLSGDELRTTRYATMFGLLQENDRLDVGTSTYLYRKESQFGRLKVKAYMAILADRHSSFNFDDDKSYPSTLFYDSRIDFHDSYNLLNYEQLVTFDSNWVALTRIYHSDSYSRIRSYVFTTVPVNRASEYLETDSDAFRPDFFNLQNNPGAGNCQFCAVAIGYNDFYENNDDVNTVTQEQLRASAIRYLEEHKNDADVQGWFALDEQEGRGRRRIKTIDEYIAVMRKDGTYGTRLSLYAMACELGIRIFVKMFTKNKPGGDDIVFCGRYDGPAIFIQWQGEHFQTYLPRHPVVRIHEEVNGLLRRLSDKSISNSNRRYISSGVTIVPANTQDEMLQKARDAVIGNVRLTPPSDQHAAMEIRAELAVGRTSFVIPESQRRLVRQLFTYSKKDQRYKWEYFTRFENPFPRIRIPFDPDVTRFWRTLRKVVDPVRNNRDFPRMFFQQNVTPNKRYLDELVQMISRISSEPALQSSSICAPFRRDAIDAVYIASILTARKNRKGAVNPVPPWVWETRNRPYVAFPAFGEDYSFPVGGSRRVPRNFALMARFLFAGHYLDDADTLFRPFAPNENRFNEPVDATFLYSDAPAALVAMLAPSGATNTWTSLENQYKDTTTIAKLGIPVHHYDAVLDSVRSTVLNNLVDENDVMFGNEDSKQLFRNIQFQLGVLEESKGGIRIFEFIDACEVLDLLLTKAALYAMEGQMPRSKQWWMAVFADVEVREADRQTWINTEETAWWHAELDKMISQRLNLDD